jgi:ABC-2 type transport system permease protein
MTASLSIAVNETRKGLWINWHYKVNLLLEMLMLAGAFVGISFLVGRGQLQSEEMASYFLGYVMWYYASQTITDMSWHLRDEIQTGTLEQMYMSPAPAGFLILGQSLATLLVTTVMVGLIGALLVIVLRINLPFEPAVVPVFGLTIFGLFGFGFLIAGATLVFKHVEAFGDLLQYLLIFLNGAWLPVDQFPAWLSAIARLMPTTQGIIVMRQILFKGQSLSGVWQDGSLPWLLAQSVIMFGGGWLIFRWGETIAKRQGSLGQY